MGEPALRPAGACHLRDAVLLSGKIENVKRRLYILADGWDPSPFRYFAKKYTGAPGWEVIKLPSGHDVMVDMPDELA